jgi:hypothetical protein
MSEGETGQAAPTHWRQFDQLYDLPDPRPYFRGVAGGAYRMPGVVAGLLERLIPVMAARKGGGTVRLTDFACGYGAVGLCLRFGFGMDGLYRYFAEEGDPASDPGAFAALRRADLPDHRIDGIDIAGRALAYAEAVGAAEAGHAVDVMGEEPGPAVAEALGRTDLIFECGALGDHIAPAANALLRLAAPAQPWMLFCPRPRVDVARLRETLAGRGYRLETLVPGVRYRKPFSEGEAAEEIAAGLSHGLSAEDCLIDGYFRVDVRLAVPEGEDSAPAHAAVAGFEANA